MTIHKIERISLSIKLFLSKDRMLPVVQVVHGRGEAGGHPQAFLPPNLVERLQVRLLEQLGKTVAGDELGDHPEVQTWLVGHHPVVPGNGMWKVSKLVGGVKRD